MLAWMICVLVVTSLLTCAGLAAERAARIVRAPTRWLWLLSMLTSTLLPTVVMSDYIPIPHVRAPSVAETLMLLRGSEPAQAMSLPWITGRDIPPSTLCIFFQHAWVVLSAITLVVIVACASLLLWRTRLWINKSIGGTFVLVAPDAGPAAFGLLRPRIVVPKWIERAPLTEQILVMAHEQSHIEARDSQILSLALCLLVFMPWNIPLWHQLRRLRHAIEVDCDSRVLKGGHDANRYSEMLIEVAQRQSTFIGAVTAMSWPKSLLEERIRIILRYNTRWRGGAVTLFGLLALSLAAIAFQLRAC
jgi:bla regulator protein blaR1